MSVGFSISDIIAVIDLAKKIRREFVDAPSQFNEISDEVRYLFIVLQDVEVEFSESDLNNQQKTELEEIGNSSLNVLRELDEALHKYTEARSETSENGMERAWKKLTREPEDIKDLRGRIAANVTLFLTFQGKITSSDGLHERYDIREREGRDQAILEWISPINNAAQQSDYVGRRHEGTGQWLLDSEEFKAWVETNGQTLFCPGVPGAGKTILTSIVIDELIERFYHDNNIGLAYLFCNFRRQDEQCVDELLLSLLKQLAECQPSIASSVEKLYNRHKSTGTRPTADEAARTLQSIAATFSRVFIIVDALDECQVSDGTQTRLLSELFGLQVMSKANIFATSRCIPEIAERFAQGLTLEIRATSEDVGNYLDSHMLRLPGFVSRSPELQEEIKSSIIRSGQGMFLLAQLLLGSLVGRRSPKAIRNALETLPSGAKAYDNAYENCMDQISGQVKDQEELAKQALMWITFAKRPLTISEIQHALAVEIGESALDETNIPEIEDIVSVCAGLITVDEESQIIRLVHLTAQEYLERTREHWCPDAETRITAICATYLSFDIFGSGICKTDKKFEERLRANLFYDYASKNWGYHASGASTVIPEVAKLLEKNPQVEASIQGLLTESVNGLFVRKKITGLHLATCFGFVALAEHLLGIAPDTEITDSEGQTPLFWAATHGHIEIVKLLVDKGANMTTVDNHNWTPLHAASQAGHVETMELLLDKGANLLTPDNDGWTPLHIASQEGQSKAIRLLLDRGAGIAATDKRMRTALHLASQGGHVEAIGLLLDEGADLESPDDYGHSPLNIAAGLGQVEAVQALLYQGANTSVRNIAGWTPMHSASYGGHTAIVRILFEDGADVMAIDYWGRTPLHLAVEERGNIEIVKLLPDLGAEANMIDSEGQTPLDIAWKSGYEDIMKVLLDRGAKSQKVVDYWVICYLNVYGTKDIIDDLY